MKSVLTITLQDKTVHTEPVATVDEAKEKLDAYNELHGFKHFGHIVLTDENGNTAVWRDDEFDISDLDAYFEELDENGGYDSHAEFTEDNGAFHGKLDSLFSGL